MLCSTVADARENVHQVTRAVDDHGFLTVDPGVGSTRYSGYCTKKKASTSINLYNSVTYADIEGGPARDSMLPERDRVSMCSSPSS